MTTIRIIISIIFIYVAIILQAQQLPLFTQYGEYRGLLNPSSVTNDYFLHDFNVSYGLSSRLQWTSVPGSPQTFAGHADFTINTGNTFNFLMGGYILNHTTGPISTTGVYGRLTTIMSDYDPLYGGIAFGANVGVVQYRVDVSELRKLYPGDILTATNQSKIYPDLGLGVTYYKNFDRGLLRDDIIYLGFSVPQMFGLNLLFKDDFGEFNYKQVRHFYSFISYFRSLKQSSFLEFSSWIKFVPNAPVNIDFNVRYQMSPTVWIGTGLSSAGIAHIEFGLYLDEFTGYDRLKIGVSYDPPFTTYGARFGGSYEFSLGYAVDNRGL